MGHGKETPRQKMIGMMYLMLTAMLALNVSKEVLNAFANVDEGIMKAVENTHEKTGQLFGRFQSQNEMLPDKVGPFFRDAQKVKEKAEDVSKYIEDSKREIIRIADGKDAKALKSEDIKLIDISAKDNTSIPAQVMVGPEGKKGNGYKLKEEIEEFREMCLGYADDNEALRSSIESALHTGKVKHADQVYDWVPGNFEHLPLAGVIAIMSGIENSVRNVEADVINYLYSKIDQGTVKFNKIDAMVVPNSDYVIKGNDYKADIFFAAYDTTTDPQIYIGDYKEIKDDEGNVIDYEMTRIDDSVNATGGIGQYVKSGNTTGQQEYKGLIVLQTPTRKIKKPFSKSYEVAAAQAVVSPTKMNVFYLGLPNPVDISVSGVQPDKISASINNGSIRRGRGGGWVVKPGRVGDCRVTVYAEIEDERKPMGSKEFRIKVVPDPVAKVAGKIGGEITRGELQAQSIVSAELPDFLFDLKFDVVKFNVYTTDRAGFVQEASSNNNRITKEQKDIIRGLKRNQKVYFEEIKVKKPGGIVVDVPSINLKIK